MFSRIVFIRHPVRFLMVVALLVLAFGVFSAFVCRVPYSDEIVEILVESDSIDGESDHFDRLDPVERSPERLRDAAVEFADKVGLREQVYELYQEQELEEFASYIRRMRKRPVSKAKPVIRKRVVAQPRASVVRRKKEHWDPRFSLPIPRGSFWLSSPFGPRKKANGKQGFHHGVDMAANRGTPIRAAGSGVVTEAGWGKGYGNTVVIKHDDRFTTRYAHMDNIKVRVGQKVSEGAVIGCVGATGYVRKSGGDGSHLHFEVRDCGRSCNPFYFLK